MTAQRFHLPQAVLRGDVSLREEQVVFAGCMNGRHALRIARDGDGPLQAVDGERAVDGRQRRAHHVARPDRSNRHAYAGEDRNDKSRKEESPENSPASAVPGRVYASINLLACEQTRLRVRLRPQGSEPIALSPLQRRFTRIVRKTHPSAEFTSGVRCVSSYAG